MSHASLGKLPLKQISADRWRFTQPFTYDGVTIPKGFELDGASSLGVFIKPWGGHYAVAVAVHDYLYDLLNHGKVHPRISRKPIPKPEARRRIDALLRQHMKVAKVRPLVRFGMWFAVRSFGSDFLKKAFVS